MIAEQETKAFANQAQSIVRGLEKKRKQAEISLEDAQYTFWQECGKAQRTARVIFYKATTTCENFYETIHEGIRCIHDTVTTTDQDKEKALKERCVMVNDWNIGIMNKRCKLAARGRSATPQKFVTRISRNTLACEQSLVDVDKARLYGFDDRSESDADLVDIDLRDDSAERDEDNTEHQDYVCDNEYWNTTRMRKKTRPGQVENEVILRKQTKSGLFGEGSSRRQALDHLIDVFKKNISEFSPVE